jgi:hypothetical protein
MVCHVFLLRTTCVVERCVEHKTMLWRDRVANRRQTG